MQVQGAQHEGTLPATLNCVRDLALNPSGKTIQPEEALRLVQFWSGSGPADDAPSSTPFDCLIFINNSPDKLAHEIRFVLIYTWLEMSLFPSLTSYENLHDIPTLKCLLSYYASSSV